jgi:hypothetical protein
MKVLSIDIGISNLGYIYAEMGLPELSGSKYKNIKYNEVYCYSRFKNLINIIDCNRIDITKVKHNFVKRCDCKLFHERCIPDYLDHFIQEYQNYFENCDILLLERQPPVGITNVQDLLFTKFRNKVLLISPNSVHKYFGLSDVYSNRKVVSEKIAKEFLNCFENFNVNTRKHDISDAMLMVIYYLKTEIDNLIGVTKFENESLNFEQFRF